MPAITIVKESKNYLIIKLPRRVANNLGFGERKKLTASDVRARSREAIRLHRKGRLPVLRSLRELR